MLQIEEIIRREGKNSDNDYNFGDNNSNYNNRNSNYKQEGDDSSSCSLKLMAHPEYFQEFIRDLDRNEFDRNYRFLRMRSIMGLNEYTCGDEQLRSKNLWNMSVINGLGMNVEDVSKYNGHLRNIYCGFLCQNPCKQAKDSSQELLEYYEREKLNR